MFIYTVSDIYIAVCGIILILEQSKLLNTNVKFWYVFWKISEDLVIAYILELILWSYYYLKIAIDYIGIHLGDITSNLKSLK